MRAEAQTLLSLLTAERQAVTDADIGRLVELQDQKRSALAQLQQSGAAERDFDGLAAMARENIQLMRHLVSVLSAMLSGGSAPVYGASGESLDADVGQRRGAL